MEKTEDNYTLFDWWKKVVFKNYANFNGRARRKEYWNFTLTTIIILLSLYLPVIIVISLDINWLTRIVFFPFLIFCFGIIIPWFAVAVRRLHDTNKTGWLLLLRLVPLFSIILFIFFIIEGDNGRNNYGKDPKSPPVDELDQIGLE